MNKGSKTKGIRFVCFEDFLKKKKNEKIKIKRFAENRIKKKKGSKKKMQI